MKQQFSKDTASTVHPIIESGTAASWRPHRGPQWPQWAGPSSPLRLHAVPAAHCLARKGALAMRAAVLIIHFDMK
jgi:hypothetical protein